MRRPLLGALVGVTAAAALVAALPATASATSLTVTDRRDGATMNLEGPDGSTTFAFWQTAVTSDITPTPRRSASVYFERDSASCGTDGSCTYTSTTIYGDGLVPADALTIDGDLAAATLAPTPLPVRHESYTLDADGNVVSGSESNTEETVSASFTATGDLSADPWHETVPGADGILSVQAQRWRAADAVVHVGDETFEVNGADGTRIYSGTQAVSFRGE
jgi:hypothetical protein